MRKKGFFENPGGSRRDFVKTVAIGTGATAIARAAGRSGTSDVTAKPNKQRSIDSNGAFRIKICFQDLPLRLWYRKGSSPPDDRKFWDKSGWDHLLNDYAREGYNALVYGPFFPQWQAYLIRHSQFPEARELSPEVQEPIIEQVKWIFAKAHHFGLRNFLMYYHVVTSPAFAKAHGFDRILPESETVSQDHNLWLRTGAGPHVGIRNELTRAFTEAATLELLQTYDDLDGFYGEMGEALPGKRSTWYVDAIVPALKRSGRNPTYIVQNWMMPREDFIQDIARPEVYQNTWLAVMPNGEMFTDAKPYPDIVQWAEEAGVPCVMGLHMHNYQGGFPFNSPRLAYEMVNEFKKVENCAGFSAQLSDNPNYLFRQGLAYYGTHLNEPYSDEHWVAILEERFGDHEASQHILNAYNASAWICPELCAQFWHNTDGYQGRHLHLSYFFFTDEDPRYAGWYTSPARGTDLNPIRRYAQIVAKYGARYRDNSGADYTRPPYAQRMIMGPADYQCSPEAQMRKIRQLGETSLKEAELAVQMVKRNKDEAKVIRDYMKGYKLLTDYYEQKALAGISAMIYRFGGPKAEKVKAEDLGDKTVQLYRTANVFIWENIDKKRGHITSQWQGKRMTLPELLEYEQQEREQMGKLFNWPAA